MTYRIRYADGTEMTFAGPLHSALIAALKYAETIQTDIVAINGAA
jgi:hypothetical protein